MNPSTISQRQRLKWRYRKDWLTRLLFRMLSENHGGLRDSVPLTGQMLDIKDKDGSSYCSMFLNDSFEIGLGWEDGWHVIYRREIFHRIIFWYLRQWIFREWLGLRRKLWYAVLQHKVLKRIENE